jgi:hypothetical protein
MVGLYIILGWIFVGCLAWIYFYFHNSARMTSSASGSVVSAKEREIRDKKGRRDETVVTFTFRTQGKEFQVAHVFVGRQAHRFTPGLKLPVKYNPANPNMAKVSLKG